MENNQRDQEQIINEIYDFAAYLMIDQGYSSSATKQALIEEKGLDDESATLVVENLGNQIKNVKKEGANKDMLYGALWCVGGIIATIADFGYIFWGAIIFGAFQFIKGAANSN
jgi:hypothetical protein